MKKLVLGTAVMFMLGIAAQAMAFDFTFHGSMWHCFAATNNADRFKQIGSRKTNYFSYGGALNLKGDKAANYTVMDDNRDDFLALTKMRLRFEGTTDDGRAKFVYALEVGTYEWGDTTKKLSREYGFGLSGDGVNVESRFIYLDLRMPLFDAKDFIRAGLQSTKINHWVWTETAPGLTYRGKKNDWSWEVGWFRGDTAGKDPANDNDYFIGKFGYKGFPGLNVNFFAIYENAGNDTTSIGDQYNYEDVYLGLSGKFKSGALFGNFDVISQTGTIDIKGKGDLDRQGWLGNLTLGFKVTPAFKLSINGLYVSGDDDPNDGDADNFDAIDVDVKVGMIYFKDTAVAGRDRFFNDGPYIQDKGLLNLALQAEYQINKANKIRAAIRHLWTEEDLTYVDGSGRSDDDLGTELDFWYTYRYNKYVKLKFEGGYLFAGDASDAMASTGEADNVFQIASEIEFKF